MNHFIKKKSLGQHFLNDESVAQEIVHALDFTDLEMAVLEIGPGLGVLTKYLIEKFKTRLYISEIDERILRIASQHWLIPESNILNGNFLKNDFQKITEAQFAIIGNFPYNISSQIIFKALEFKNRIPLLVGMFQYEMAKRVVAQHGNKDYGVLSVLTQAYYQSEYLLSVSATKFSPPPKVESAVIRLRKKTQSVEWDEVLFRKIVKLAFNQRRKKLSNAMSSLSGAVAVLKKNDWAHLRAETLSVQDYIQFTFDLQNEEGINNG